MYDLAKLAELQEIVTSTTEKMVGLKDDLTTVMSYIDDKTMIPSDVSERVVLSLQDIDKLNSKCKVICAGLNLEIPNKDNLDSIEISVASAIDDAQKNSKIEIAKIFLQLDSKDESVKLMLNEQKTILREAIDGYSDDNDSTIEPFYKFVMAINEEDSSKVVTWVLELSTNFSTDLINQALIQKSIYISKEIIVADKLSDIELPNQEATENVEKSKIGTTNEEKSNDTGTNESVPVINEGIEETGENIVEQSVETILEEYGISIADEIEDLTFAGGKTPAEDKKSGAKIFIGDIKSRYWRVNESVIKYLDMHNAATAKTLSSICDFPIDEIELSLNYLMSRGYVRKYSVLDLGCFYSISPKGNDCLKKKDVRAFIKIKGKPSEGEIVEDYTAAVLNRIALANLFDEFINVRQISTAATYVSEESFITTYGFKDISKSIVIAGSFWDKYPSPNEFVNIIKKDYEEAKQELIIAGLNLDCAMKIVNFVLNELKVEKEKIYLYSLSDGKFYEYASRKISSAENILCDNTQDVLVNVDSKKEELVDEIETIEESNEIVQNEQIVEIIESSNDFNSIMSNTYEMIIANKTFCATTYLRSLMDKIPEASIAYDKLAYAVNAPWKRCSYSSQKVFSLYTDSDIFSNYLMASAALRNFFMNHLEYDYDMKALHTNVSGMKIISENAALSNALYSMISFKDEVHKGINFYADYRVRDKVVLQKKIAELSGKADLLYSSCVMSPPRNHKGVKRYVDTWKLIFSIDGDIATYLKAVKNNDYDVTELIKDFLKDNFISADSTLDASNIDSEKLNKFIDDFWDRAYKKTGSQYKTSDLKGDLRNNLVNSVEKPIALICEWISLLEDADLGNDDYGTKRYKEIRNELIEDLNNAEKYISENSYSEKSELAGSMVLSNSIREMISRLDGTYDEKSYKYFYIDFLRGNDVLLDEEYLPDMRGQFDEFEELSMPSRVLKHSKTVGVDLTQKLDEICNESGDNYGSAKLIISYLEDMGDYSCSDKYMIDKSAELAEKEARIRLDEFVNGLELAQAYGRIEEANNKKERIQKIANEWFEYAKESQNYGFFKMLLDKYDKKIFSDAKVRGNKLLTEINRIKEQSDFDDDKLLKIKKIQEMIEAQNYTVAEDLLAKIDNDDVFKEFPIVDKEYLRDFIKEYDSDYKQVSDSSRALRDLVRTKVRNKDDKAATKLIENWMSNGGTLTDTKVKELLGALGFAVADVRSQEKIEKIYNFSVTLEETSGRKTNYKHPIAAFGSKATKEEFRVICLYGKYDADRLIEEFKNVGNAKNTLVLLDYALPLPERRRLARKIKSELGDKVFAVLDRVLIMYLFNNYNIQFVNKMLMATMMPFAYYQPYVWDSSKVMPPEIFMGRKEELEKIESPSGVNIVYGGRQLGKSALLKMAWMNVDNDENGDRAVYVEIKGLDYERVAKKIGQTLFDVGILDEDINTTDWDDLARAIKKRLQDKSRPIPYLLLLLDEADAFIDSCEPINYRPFDILKDIQSTGIDRFKFVIAGLHNIVRFKREAALSNNSVLTHLTSITIKPFGMHEACQLLEEPLSFLGLRFADENLIPTILANTNYFPGLIQLYCTNLIESMRKKDYAGYDEHNTPVYDISSEHMRKMLSDKEFTDQVREKFEITLKLDEDNMYYIIALLMAYLYHTTSGDIEGFSAANVIDAAKDYGVKKVAVRSETEIDALMMELLELNVLRKTVNGLYLFSRYNFFQMMGTSSDVENKLVEYMED